MGLSGNNKPITPWQGSWAQKMEDGEMDEIEKPQLPSERAVLVTREPKDE